MRVQEEVKADGEKVWDGPTSMPTSYTSLTDPASPFGALASSTSCRTFLKPSPPDPSSGPTVAHVRQTGIFRSRMELLG